MYNLTMLKGPRKNKMIHAEDKQVKTKKPYFFPTYGITIEAENIKEAEEKLYVIINKKK